MGSKQALGEHPVPSFLLLPLELRQELDPSCASQGVLWPPEVCVWAGQHTQCVKEHTQGQQGGLAER